MSRMFHLSVHVRYSYASYVRSSYVATFHADITELDRFTASEKKYSWLPLFAWLSGLWDPSQFLSQHNHWSSTLKPNIYWWICYISLLGPYHQHMISTFNTCSWGPTYQSLTDTGGGYNLRGADLLHHTPRPFQPRILHFPPKGTARSQVK
jgi:hypothetical protein